MAHYQALPCPRLPSNRAMTEHTTHATPSKDEIAQLPAFERLGLDRIVLVNSARAAGEALSELQDHPAWGFDTESKPTFFKDQVSDGPHIVQLATLQRAWVFQLHDPHCQDAVAALLSRAGHTLAGFGLGDDRKRLKARLGVEPEGILDLNAVFRARGYRKDMGVKAAVAVIFQQRFIKSKKAATSNWAHPVLSEAQLIYATNDAWAAARVHHALASR